MKRGLKEMLIGKFADKFKVKVDTVRYYIEQDLLIPEKKGHYYHFDNSTIKDMEFIVKLKSYHFSIKEISHILSVKRLTPFTHKEDYAFFIQVLENKQIELKKLIHTYEESIKEIEKDIQKYNAVELETAHKKGIPLVFLSLLHCPLCQKELMLMDAQITNQQIYGGRLECSCFYKATIQNGVILTNHLHEEAYNPFYIYDVNMINTIKSSLVSIIEKCSLQVKKLIFQEDLKHKVVLEPNVDTDVFLNRFSKELNPHALYIFTGSTIPMLKILKMKIEAQNPNLNVLYILNSGLDLPLKKNCIDIVIDSYSFNEFSLFHDFYPLYRLKPYLHKESIIIGSYFSYDKNSKSIINMKEMYPRSLSNNLTTSFMIENLHENRMTFIVNEVIGEIINPGKYLKYHVKGETASFHVYSGKNSNTSLNH